MRLIKKHYLIFTFVTIFLILIFVIGIFPSNLINHPLLERYKSIFKLLSDISITVGVIGVVITYLLREDTTRLNEYLVTNGLMLRYNELLPNIFQITEITGNDEVLISSILYQYYNLSEEQLFYINRGTIPLGIDLIWVRGIRRQIIWFLDLQEEYNMDDNEPDLNFVDEYIIPDTYPFLHILYLNYNLNNQISDEELLHLIKEN